MKKKAAIFLVNVETMNNMNSCIKPKKCKACGTEFIPFRTFDKYCSAKCAATNPSKPLKRTPLKPLSNKRKDQLGIYKQMRRRYLQKTPKCERCGQSATEIHHKAGRTNNLLNDSKHFMAICRPCHRWVHDNPEDARNNDWLL